MNEDYIDAIVTISNHIKVIEMCEPDVFSHQTITKWHVKRILKAQELIENELRRIDTTGTGTVSEEE